MKYYNKTRTIEQKVTDREVVRLLEIQADLLNRILKHLENTSSK